MVDAHSVNLSEDVRVKDGSNTPSQALTTNKASAPEPTEEKKHVSCVKCGDTICGEDELWRFKYNGKTCDYCTRDYCDECFPQHICSSSELCTHCDRRFSNEFVAVAQYCRKKYCSVQCVNLCLEKNKDRPECWGCGKREEEAYESDQDEDSEEVYDCPACETSFEEDVNMSYICMDCEDEYSFFCSRRCFGRYHRRKGLDHEGMTFGEFDKKF
jgi:hypothetical protein